MSHRSIFKPMKDRPSLDVVMKAPPCCTACRDEDDCSSVNICMAVQRAFSGDAKRTAESLNHGR